MTTIYFQHDFITGIRRRLLCSMATKSWRQQYKWVHLLQNRKLSFSWCIAMSF